MKTTEEREAEGRFYQMCADLLGTTHTYHPWPSPTRGPNRWNNRHAGNGRYPDHGVIRMFGATCIQVSLRHPVPINQMCKSEEEVFALIRSITGGPVS